MSLVLQVLVYGILLGGVYAVMAYGLGLIYGVMRIVNLAHGAVLMLAAYAAFELHARWNVDPIASALAIVPAAYVTGRVLYQHVVSRVASGPPMAAMLLLFGVGLCARNLAYVVWTGDDQTVALSYGLSTVDLGVPVAATRLVVFVIALATTAALFVVFRFTHTGRAVRAVARDPVAAELSGISVPRVSARAFGAGTALGALGGVLLSTLYVINPEFGGPFLLKSFCIIVLGGMDSMPGILAGALTLGVAETAAGVYGGSAWQDLVSFVLLVLILVARPGGLPSLVKR
ncbi:MAG: branched-chain amino acid ABC transporter permease [Vicinamibacterales bacterium]